MKLHIKRKKEALKNYTPNVTNTLKKHKTCQSSLSTKKKKKRKEDCSCKHLKFIEYAIKCF